MATKKGSINLSFDPKAFVHKLSSFFASHGPILFIMLSFGLLAYSVYSVNRILTAPEDTVYSDQKSSEGTTTRFDKKTIDSIQQLKTAETSGSTLTLPPGRINPFAE